MAQHILIIGDDLADQRRQLRQMLIDLGIWHELYGNPTAICVIAGGNTPDEDAEFLRDLIEEDFTGNSVSAALPPEEPEND